MKKVNFFLPVLIICFNLILCSGQDKKIKTWYGDVNAASGNGGIPNATIASYSNVCLFSANEKGFFSLTLPLDDSLRVTAVGFMPEIFVLKDQIPDSSGVIHLYLQQQVYALKGVTVKAEQKGIFDPLIFPKVLPEGINNIQGLYKQHHMAESPLHLSPRGGSVSMNFASLILGGNKSIKNFAKAKLQEIEWKQRDAVAGKDVIMAVSGFKGQQLDDFIIYCNINLEITSTDNGISAIRKIEALLKQFIEEKAKTMN